MQINAKPRSDQAWSWCWISSTSAGIELFLEMNLSMPICSSLGFHGSGIEVE
jgi:hypothetical protein